MADATLTLDVELLEVLRLLDQPVEEAARELIIMGLHRRGSIPQGKAAKLLGMPLADYLRHAGAMGIPYFRFTKEEFEAELRAAARTPQERSVKSSAAGTE